MPSAGTLEDVAEKKHKRGGWRQQQGQRVDTWRIAMDRQHSSGPACTVGTARQQSAFRPFPAPADSASARSGAAATVPAVNINTARSHLADAAAIGSDQHGSAVGGSQQQRRQSQRRAGKTQSKTVAEPLEVEALHPVAKQAPEGQVLAGSATSPDADKAGPSSAAMDVTALTTEQVKHADTPDMLEEIRDLGGDAWKVFCMASKMGLRPEVVQNAAKRLKSLKQNVQ